MITKLLLILFTSIFIENYVFTKFYGICPFIATTKKASSALGMGLAVAVVMTLSGAVTWALYRFVLVPYDLIYLKTIAFLLVIGFFVQLLELVLKAYLPSLCEELGIYLPLIATNCAVLGTCLTNVAGFKSTFDHFATAVVYSFGSSLGLLLAMLLFAAVRSRLKEDMIPKAFRGLPIALISAGLCALAFAGFSRLSF